MNYMMDRCEQCGAVLSLDRSCPNAERKDHQPPAPEGPQ